MNVGSAIVLLVIAVLLALCVRYLLRKRNAGCAGCSEESCAYHGTNREPPTAEAFDENGNPVSCPAVDRMMASVTDRLDSADAGTKASGVQGRG